MNKEAMSSNDNDEDFESGCPIRIRRVTNGFLVESSVCRRSLDENVAVFASFDEVIDWVSHHFFPEYFPKIKKAGP